MPPESIFCINGMSFAIYGKRSLNEGFYAAATVSISTSYVHFTVSTLIRTSFGVADVTSVPVRDTMRGRHTTLCFSPRKSGALGKDVTKLISA